MKQFNITGMSCAACQARVEKAVSELPGVDSCAVSLLTNSMGVEGSASGEEIIRAVIAAGYGATIKEESDYEDALKDRETPALRKRLLASLAFLVALILIKNGWAQMGLALVVMLINREFFISGAKSVVHGSANMDTLVALGSATSFLWSVYALISGSGDLYFMSAAMILAFITVGKMLEARSKGRTTDALKSLIRMAPKKALVVRDDREISVEIEEVVIGDVFVVRPGESVPVDGVVLEGETSIDESALTGESIPVNKVAGASVSAATINQSGRIKCKATRVGEDTTFAQIIKMVNEAAATKAPIAKLADKVSGVFVPVVIVIAAITFVIWMMKGAAVDWSLARAISVLVISCPCALGLATPVAIMVGNGVGAKHGILFKTAASLEETGKANIVVLDKTGTVTRGVLDDSGVVVGDEIKEDSRDAIADMKSMGLKVVLLTGDNETRAKEVADATGIEQVVSGVKPDGKEAVVRQLKEQGKVIMVGDGINDAPALTTADMGIAIGAGTDVAIDAADVVVMNSNLSDVTAAIRLSRATLRNIRQNLFWAFIYNALCIPLAAGCYIGLFGWQLSPMVGAAAMSLSSFCVVSNAVRLNVIDIYNKRTENNNRVETKESTMTKTMIIEGMMCPHCEARVKKAIEAIDGVESAVVNHVEGTAVVTLSKAVDDAVLKEAVEAQDYPVNEIN